MRMSICPALAALLLAASAQGTAVIYDDNAIHELTGPLISDVLLGGTTELGIGPGQLRSRPARSPTC
jgi:hypothetical protein